MLTEEPVLLEDAAIETLSTLEALDDITDTVEAIVLSFGAEPERDAYFAIADEFESSPAACRKTLRSEPGRTRPGFWSFSRKWTRLWR